MRAHLYRLMQDSQGNLVPDVTVRVLEPGTTTLIGDALYPDSDSASPMANPFVSPTGVINFYLDSPRRVRLGVSTQEIPERFYENVDVLAAEEPVPDEIRIKSPDGSVYLITVTDDGTLVTVPAGE